METQGTISDWAEATFGPAGSDLRVASRANEELAETIRAMAAKKSTAEVGLELADTMIVLCRLGSRLLIGLTIPKKEAEPTLTLERHIAAANRQMSSVIESLVYGVQPHSPVRILWDHLCEAVFCCGATPQEVIDAKMAVNRLRVWKQDGTGHGYHVREKVPA